MGPSSGRVEVEVEEVPSAREPQGQENWSVREVHSCPWRAAMPPVLTMTPAFICWCCAMLRNWFRLERDPRTGDQRRTVVGAECPGQRKEQDTVGSSQRHWSCVPCGWCDLWRKERKKESSPGGKSKSYMSNWVVWVSAQIWAHLRLRLSK